VRNENKKNSTTIIITMSTYEPKFLSATILYQTVDLEEQRAPMEQLLTNYYHLISMHHEEEERKQNWMLRTNCNHVPPNTNLLYGRTYPELSPQDLLGGPALMGCFLTDCYPLKSMHHEEEERKQN